MRGCSVAVPIGACIPQNHARISGEVAIGDFIYQAYETRKVDTPYEMDNPGTNYYFTQDLASVVKRATALELEKSGARLSRNSNVLFANAFSPPRITVHLMPAESIPNVLNSAILRGYEMFIADFNEIAV